MSKYLTRENLLKVSYKFMKEEGITKKEFSARLERARLWHNPRNLKDNGQDLKVRYGWGIMFDDARVIEGLTPGRFYFYFKDVDCTDFATVAREFYNCKNYAPYLEVWRKHAPEEFNSELYFLLSLVTMTVKGMKHEKKVIEKNGYTPASGEEDLKGVDAYDGNGNPIQIKSPRTQYLLDKENGR